MRREQPWLTNRSRALRANETSAEDVVWQAIRNRQLGGFKFVRQFPIGPYFADFACRERQIIIEIDGVTHGTEEEMAADAVRTRKFSELGFQVFRASNSDIYENLEGVLDALLAFIEADATSRAAQPAAAPHPNPLPMQVHGESDCLDSQAVCHGF